jgi:hypothetical protein
MVVSTGETVLRSFFLLLVLLTLAGCGSAPSRVYTPEEIAKLSMIYGYIDMKDAPTSLGNVQLRRMRPVEDAPFYRAGVKEGYFLRINLPDGAYKVTSIGGTRGSTVYTFNMETQGKGDMDREVTRPGAYFAGAWKFKLHKKGLLQQDEFDLEPLASPGEREVLEKLLKLDLGMGTEAETAAWRKRMEQRLAELKRRK